jgi:hypothetical protein
MSTRNNILSACLTSLSTIKQSCSKHVRSRTRQVTYTLPKRMFQHRTSTQQRESQSSSQTTPGILWNQKINYHVHKSRACVTTNSKTKPRIHTEQQVQSPICIFQCCHLFKEDGKKEDLGKVVNRALILR